MTVQEIINKHKYCNFIVIDNQDGQRILESDNLQNLDNDILNEEVKEYHTYYNICTSEDSEGREFVVCEYSILEIILYV
jgi:hypothetical protein